MADDTPYYARLADSDPCGDESVEQSEWSFEGSRRDASDSDVGRTSDRNARPSRRGYRNPPVEHRFKKGSSGNPKGRPRGSNKHKCIKDQLYEAATKVFGEELFYTSNGKRKRSSSHEVILRGLKNEALHGDRHARREYVKLALAFRAETYRLDDKFLKRSLTEGELKVIFKHLDVLAYQKKIDEQNYEPIDFSKFTREQMEVLEIILSPDAAARRA